MLLYSDFCDLIERLSKCINCDDILQCFILFYRIQQNKYAKYGTIKSLYFGNVCLV